MALIEKPTCICGSFGYDAGNCPQHGEAVRAKRNGFATGAADCKIEMVGYSMDYLEGYKAGIEAALKLGGK